MQRTSLGAIAICLLIGFVAFIPTGNLVGAGARGKDPELRRINQALEDARENKKTGERLIRQILNDIERTEGALHLVGTVVSAKRGSKSIIAMPDVCKTPSSASPPPIPYPNIAGSSDTSKGSKKVKAGAAFAQKASSDEAGSRALLDHLRTVRSEVETRHDFVAGLCKKCKLQKKDKQILQQWLTSTKKEIRRQQAQFDDYVQSIEQARRSHRQR